MEKLSHTADEHPDFIYCEHVWATATSRWHIRRFGPTGRWKLGGGCPPPLCWVREETWAGWDLSVTLRPAHDDHTCPACLAKYKELRKKGKADVSKT